jgi:NitT/TauT family transport system permease protein
MSALFDVPLTKRLRLLVGPGIFSYWLAAFSAILANGWKAAAVAEFLGSHSGVGAKIFWSYRALDMAKLNAWALALIILVVALEWGLIAPMRRKATALTSRNSNS